MFREELWREGIGIAIIRRVKDCRFDLIFRVESQAELGFYDPSPDDAVENLCIVRAELML